MINLDSYASVRSSLFLRWDVEEYATYASEPYSTQRLTFTDHFEEVTLSGITYTPLGKMLSVSPSQSTIGGTAAGVTIGISGIPYDNIQELIYSKFKGSLMRMYRGYYDVSTNTQIGGFSGRFFGYVNNYSIEEEYNYLGRDQTVKLVVDCNSWIRWFEQKLWSRQTNETTMKRYYSNDTSMDNVTKLKNREFNFGKTRTSGGTLV